MLWNLCTGTRVGKEGMVDGKGLDACLAALSAHPEGAEVQEAGCGALVSMAHGWADGQRFVAAAGGRAAALRAMGLHRTHARIQLLGAQLLKLVGN